MDEKVEPKIYETEEEVGYDVLKFGLDDSDSGEGSFDPDPLCWDPGSKSL